MMSRGITAWHIGSIALLMSLLIVSFPDFVSSRGPGERLSESDCDKLREYIRWAEKQLTEARVDDPQQRKRLLKQLKQGKKRLRELCRGGRSEPPPKPEKTCQQLKAELMPLFEKDKRTAIRLIDYLKTNISDDMAIRVRNRLIELRQKWIDKSYSIRGCMGLHRYLQTIPEPPPR